MEARTIDGRSVELDQSALDEFQVSLCGSMFSPGEHGFETSRTLWNAMIDRSPALVVHPLGTADVMAAVQFARKHDLLLCVRGGGHNIGGLAVADGALMLDMSPMRGVWVDSERRIARAQAGCLLGDVDRETQLHGMAAVLGFVSQTGIAGLTLGGGFGYLTRRYGWAADNLSGLEVVTAEGTLVRASEEENSDLFWGFRGGGGNFGVITGFDYKLYPVGPEVVGGVIAWHASEAEPVLDLYRSVASHAPPELTLAVLMRYAPPAPWLPAEAHGEPIVGILACYSGDPAKGEKIVAPIKGFGNPVGDSLIRRPYVQLQSLLDATQPAGRRCYWKSEYLAEIDPTLITLFVQHASTMPSQHGLMLLFHIGGALNQLEPGYSPVGNRDAHFAVTIANAWEQSTDDQPNIDWVRAAWADLQPFSTGGTYLNFLTEDEGYDRTEAALGPNIQRLAQVKAKWDPQNVFRTNRNIQPA